MLSSGSSDRNVPYGVVTVLDMIARAVSVLTFVVIPAFAVMAMSDTIARFGYRAPIPGMFDYMAALQVGLMLGAALALSTGRMTGARVRWLGERGEAVVYLIFLVAIALPLTGWLCVALLGKTSMAREMGEVSVGMVEFPVWPKLLVLALGFCLLIVQMIAEILRAIQCLTEAAWPRRDPMLWENAPGRGAA